MKAIFLSDVHLKRLTDPGSERCMIFLDHLLGKGKETQEPFNDTMITTDLLVIAGDFFDFWFERNGIVYPEFRPVINKLIQLKQSGVKISFCEGNHDFFLADYFREKLGINVYPREHYFDLNGQKICVLHGDTVDIENRRYLALRRFLRSAFSYRMQRMLPLRFLWGIARFASGISQGMSQNAQERMVKVMHDFAITKYHNGYDAVIIGHIHKAVLQEEWIRGKPRTFALLGDWIIHNTYLVYENAHFSMKCFSSEG